jgi:hypothetical protein
VHPTPVAAAVFMLASAASAYLVARRLTPPSAWVQILVALVLWEAVQLIPVHLAATMQLLGWIRRVTVPALAAVELGIFIFVAAYDRLRPGTATAQKCPINHSTLPTYLGAAAALVLCSYLAFALNMFTGFPSGSDSVIYHLPLATRWLQNGSLAIPDSRAWQFSMPGNAEIGMMLALSSGMQAAAIIPSWIAAAMLIVSVYALAHLVSHGDQPAALTVCLIVLSLPMIELQIFSAYVDLLGSASILAGSALIIAAVEQADDGKPPGNRLALYLIGGLACGISVGTKLTYCFYASVFCGLVVYTLWIHTRGQRAQALRASILVLTGILLPSLFWFARAWQGTGNPLFPLQVRVGHSVTLPGYLSSQITRPEFEFDFVQTRGEWIAYPWTEWHKQPGYLRIPYSEGSGFGPGFATFVPLGVVFLGMGVFLRQPSWRRDSRLLLLLAALVLSWWFLMERLLRFGQPIWIFACVLAAPFLAFLRERYSRAYAALLLSSFAAGVIVCASMPLHALAGRVRSRNWSRAEIYHYPALLDELPSGSVVLNASGLEEKNFPLEGRQLTNYVIPTFELPADLTSLWLQSHRAEYIVDIVPGERYSDATLLDCGAKLIDDELVRSGQARVRWRIWRTQR